MHRMSFARSRRLYNVSIYQAGGDRQTAYLLAVDEKEYEKSVRKVLLTSHCVRFYFFSFARNPLLLPSFGPGMRVGR